MSAYELQMMAKYHQADLLSEARQARLAKAARQAGGRAPTQRVVLTALAGRLHTALKSAATVLHRRGAASAGRTAGAQRSVTGHVMLRSTHLR